jgi:DNA invertase Pin-like site-specific DNA recombinase
MTRYAYVRVSTDKQDHDAQRFAISKRHDIDEWVVDTGTGRVTQPNLLKLCKSAKRNDEIYVYAFDRIGRSTASVISIVETLKRKGIGLISIKEGIDINSTAGNMIFQMLCSIAEFEACITSDRVKSGLEAARNRGVILGHPRLDRDPVFREMIEIAKKYRAGGLSYRVIKETMENEHGYSMSFGAVHSYLKDVPVPIVT